MSAGAAVFNRALRQIDYVVVMTYYGLIGFVASLFMLTVDYFIISKNDAAESNL